MTAAGTTKKKTRKATPTKPAKPDKVQPPVPYLCALVNGWHATTRNGEDKDFPCHAGEHIPFVMAALKAVLDSHDAGLLRDPSIAGGGWRMCNDDTNLWRIAADDAETVLFAAVWKMATGRHIGAARAREAVATLAVQPEMQCADWNLPLQKHAHVTLAGDGTLIMIDAKGDLITKAITRDDHITPEKCPPIAAPWTPGATCPKTDAIVAAILMRPDPVEHAALIETFWSAAAQMLLRGERPRAMRRAVVVWGEAFSGKSVLLKVLRAVADGHPDANTPSLVCQTSLEDFDTPFGLAKMPGCLLWLVDETTEGYSVKNVATFKQLVDDLPVTVNAKHKHQVAMRLGLTSFIATNSPPAWVDVSKGTSSRVLMVNTTSTFGTGPGTLALRQDDEIYADLVAEAPGILQKLALAAQAMVRAGAMPVSQETKAASDSTFAEHDRTAEFVGAAITAAPTPAHWVSNNNIVRAFRGMIYDAGGGREEGLRMTTLAMKKRLFNRIRLTFKSATRTAWPDGKSCDAQHGVWLTAQGKDWLARCLQHDDNMRQPVSGYTLVADRANGPVAGARAGHNTPQEGASDPTGEVGNVVTMPSRRPRE